MLTDCGCAAVFDGMCGWDASGNGIGDAGAVALAKALGSGQCQLKSLNLGCESMCVLPRALLGCARFVPAGMLFVGRSVACVRAEWRACVALLDAERLRVSCCCFLMCGMDATVNRISDVGALALAKALESGQCRLESLNLASESMCLAA